VVYENIVKKMTVVCKEVTVGCRWFIIKCVEKVTVGCRWLPGRYW
jgi:hypothetical protein